jgi:hypothetical protein
MREPVRGHDAVTRLAYSAAVAAQLRDTIAG